MSRILSCVSALALAAVLTAWCSSPAAGAADDKVKPVPPPVELVGKWRNELTDGKATRITVYEVRKDGTAEVDITTDSPNFKGRDRVKRVVMKVEKDRVTVVDLSHTGDDGVEDVVPVERRRERTFQFAVKDDELRWTEVGADGKPLPDRKPTVFKRVKE